MKRKEKEKERKEENERHKKQWLLGTEKQKISDFDT